MSKHGSEMGKLMDAAKGETKLLKLLTHAEKISAKVEDLEAHMVKEIFGHALPVLYMLTFPNPDECEHAISYGALMAERNKLANKIKSLERRKSTDAGTGQKKINYDRSLAKFQRELKHLDSQIIKMPDDIREGVKFKRRIPGTTKRKFRETKTSYRTLFSRYPHIKKEKIDIPPFVKVLATPLKRADKNYLIQYYRKKAEGLEERIGKEMLDEIEPLRKKADKVGRRDEKELKEMFWSANIHMLFEYARALCNLGAAIYAGRKSFESLAKPSGGEHDAFEYKYREEGADKSKERVAKLVKEANRYIEDEHGGVAARNALQVIEGAEGFNIGRQGHYKELFEAVEKLEFHVTKEVMSPEDAENLNPQNEHSAVAKVNSFIIMGGILHGAEETISKSIHQNMHDIKKELRIGKETGDRLHGYAGDAEEKIAEIIEILFKEEEGWFALYKEYVGGALPGSDLNVVKGISMWTVKTGKRWARDDYESGIRDSAFKVIDNLFDAVYDLIGIQECYWVYDRIVRMLQLTQLNNQFMGKEEDVMVAEMLAVGEYAPPKAGYDTTLSGLSEDQVAMEVRDYEQKLRKKGVPPEEVTKLVDKRKEELLKEYEHEMEVVKKEVDKTREDLKRAKDYAKKKAKKVYKKAKKKIRRLPSE